MRLVSVSPSIGSLEIDSKEPTGLVWTLALKNKRLGLLRQILSVIDKRRKKERKKSGSFK